MSIKEQQESLVSNLKRWQKLENTAVAQTADIMQKTDNPLIRMVAEIIQRDSNMHFRIQQMIIDTLQHETVRLSFEDLGAVWDAIEQHINIEKMTVEMATDSLKLLPDKTNQVQRYLLSYLLADEQKHDKMLADLQLLKKGAYY